MKKICCTILILIGAILHVTNIYAQEPQEGPGGLAGVVTIGTLAINPEDGKTIFLYIPRHTLLYDFGKTRKIKSRRTSKKSTYIEATTQDGIRALIKRSHIKTDIDYLGKYDFVVSRMLPYCLDPKTCSNIWNEFPEETDGEDWSTVWPSVAGKFISDEKKDRTHHVTLSIGGTNQEAYLPEEYNNLPIHEYGFITLLREQHPAYKFTKKELSDLRSDCGRKKTSKSKTQMSKEIALHAKASAGISADPTKAIASIVPPQIAKTITDFLGVTADFSAELAGEVTWVTNSTRTNTEQIYYGNPGELWTVESVAIERRAKDSSYEPYGTMLIKKVYSCDACQATEMTYSSILLTVFSETTNSEPVPRDPIIINDKTIAENNFPTASNDRALLSSNTLGSYCNLLDFFREQDVPKSIATYIIKEINKGTPR